MHGQQHLASGRRPSTLKEPLMQVLIAILSLLTFLAAHPVWANGPLGGQASRAEGLGGHPQGDCWSA